MHHTTWFVLSLYTALAAIALTALVSAIVVQIKHVVKFGPSSQYGADPYWHLNLEQRRLFAASSARR